jgi:hypothetical protein
MNREPFFYHGYLVTGVSALLNKKQNIKKFPLMSRGFEGRGLNRKRFNSKDITNIIQTVAGDGGAAVDQSPTLGLDF